MGGKLGTIFARSGHEVVFSYSHSKAKLERLARDAGAEARAGSPAEAARDADALLLAVHWSRVDDVLKKAGDLSGKVIVSCSLPMNADDTDLAIAHKSSGAEKLAKKIPKAPVVSAFNTVPSEVLFSVFEKAGSGRPEAGNGKRPTLVYCGENARTREIADRPWHMALSGSRSVNRGRLLSAENGYMLGHSLSNLELTDYETRSPWFPGSVVIGIGVGKDQALA